MSVKPLIGSHVSFGAPNYLLGSVKEALSYKANAFMIYLGAPQTTKRVVGVDFKIEEGKKLFIDSGCDINNIIVHAPYIVNFANADESKSEFALKFMDEEMERASKFGLKTMVFHPGSAIGLEKEEAIKKVAIYCNSLLLKHPDIKLAIETMAGKGHELCSNIDELATLISLIDHPNCGVCLDTCHLSDSGYDMSDFDSYIKLFESKIELSRIFCIHINDSKNELGSHKDRHANIGSGYIGFEAIKRIVFDSRFSNIPKILETPYVEGVAPYGQEIEALLTKETYPVV